MPEDSATASAAERASYTIWTHDKLRYGDTDRQGHVNNAVFSTFFETGRVSFLHDDELKLKSPGCEFVLAHISIDFRAELFYPGQVDIGTRVVRIGRSSFTCGQAIFKGESCAATAESVVVQMNATTRKSHPLSAAMTAWLSDRLAV
jgi:acyl-CoA thioester hydrolase